MGRELRRVSETWVHPKEKNGKYIPLFGDSFSKTLFDWELNKTKWDDGFREDYLNGGWKKREGDELNYSYEEWAGEMPDKKDYMPEWSEFELTHIQLYETTTEGTPISPVFHMDDVEKLAEWAAKHCTTFANNKATKENWLKMLKENCIYHQDGNFLFI